MFLRRRKSTAATMIERTPNAATARRIWKKLFYSRDEVVRVATLAVARARSRLPPRRKLATVTIRARTLQSSAARRIWSTLFDPRDWISYVYVPIIVPLLVLTPYFVVKVYERAHRINEIVQSLAEESRDLEEMTRLLDGPPEFFIGEKAEDLSPDDKADLKGFTILQSIRIIDLRRWKPVADNNSSIVYTYRRMKVRKEPGNHSNNFRVSSLTRSPNTRFHFPPQQFKPKLYSSLRTESGGQNLYHFEVGVDLRTLPEGEYADVIYENFAQGLFLREGIESTSLSWDYEVDTMEQRWWLLMPEGVEYRSFQLIGYPMGNPELVEIMKPVTEFRSNDFKILAFKLLGLKAGYTYELSWFYSRRSTVPH
jgi:hypothetical protein